MAGLAALVASLVVLHGLRAVTACGGELEIKSMGGDKRTHVTLAYSEVSNAYLECTEESGHTAAVVATSMSAMQRRVKIRNCLPLSRAFGGAVASLND